jgi:hypothetical protein
MHLKCKLDQIKRVLASLDQEKAYYRVVYSLYLQTFLKISEYSIGQKVLEQNQFIVTISAPSTHVKLNK